MNPLNPVVPQSIPMQLHSHSHGNTPTNTTEGSDQVLFGKRPTAADVSPKYKGEIQSVLNDPAFTMFDRPYSGLEVLRALKTVEHARKNPFTGPIGSAIGNPLIKYAVLPLVSLNPALDVYWFYPWQVVTTLPSAYSPAYLRESERNKINRDMIDGLRKLDDCGLIRMRDEGPTIQLAPFGKKLLKTLEPDANESRSSDSGLSGIQIPETFWAT